MAQELKDEILLTIESEWYWNNNAVMHACTGDDDSFKRYGQFRMYSTDENNHVNR